MVGSTVSLNNLMVGSSDLGSEGKMFHFQPFFFFVATEKNVLM